MAEPITCQHRSRTPVVANWRSLAQMKFSFEIAVLLFLYQNQYFVALYGDGSTFISHSVRVHQVWDFPRI
ncbi:hypothetical protein [Scytonema millei]|uniref:Uncharacterized protein n=1 Tax=Scytonema millei VB511283 TaxID=1245923 RepID=A0A9X5E3F3_9CYAN|nr:hypothetical protein [Scytonema millei]NHC34298.1 hypothetical protein [Scytonema millei VB511283]